MLALKMTQPSLRSIANNDNSSLSESTADSPMPIRVAQLWIISLFQT